MVVGGEDISGYSPRQLTEFRRQSVGFVFQTVNLVPFLTAHENLLVVDEIGPRIGAQGPRAGRPAAGRAGPDRPGRQPAGPAVGRRRSSGSRSAGRSMNQPDLVLFDEPTSALDIARSATRW